jgi:hypothetical protein
MPKFIHGNKEDDKWVPHVIDCSNKFGSHDLGSIVGVVEEKNR